MEKSPIQIALERAYSNPAQDWLNPDNHDKVNIALGLLDIEKSNQQIATTKELTNAVSTLQQQIPMSISELRQTISNNTEKVIKSNETLGKSNEAYARWMKWLTVALVLTGIAQVVVSVTN